LIERRINENEEQFLWRLGQEKDNGTLDLSWDEIADIMNKEFRDDESQYLTPAAYRKPYQYAKRFMDAGVFRKYGDDSSYIFELREAKENIQKEKQKLSDERTAINRKLRETARTEEDLARLESLIRENGQTVFKPIYTDMTISDNDMIIAISDFHLGTNVNNNFGVYNAEIAEKRLIQYLKQIIEIKNLYQSENAYILLIGDLISGEIHITNQLENRENLTEQVQKSAELISAFTYEISKHFKNVYVNGVAGNHSRTSFKDQVLRGNRLDNLIPWYMKAKLSSVDNVVFIDESNYDSTIGCVDIRGNRYLLVHGDYDEFSEKGISRLILMLGFKPTAIFYGHMHHCSFDEIANVKLIRSGSFCGAADDFSVTKRLSGRPSQMVCIATSDGIKTICPIELS